MTKPKNITSSEGFTVVEMLIYTIVFLIVMGGMYSLFITNSKSYTSQENKMTMNQDFRAAIDLMVREIRMAGYNPTNAVGIGFQTDADDRFNTDSNSLHFTMDIAGGINDGADNDGDGNVDEADEAGMSDGATDDANEIIRYYVYDSNKLGRDTGGAGYPQPVIENVTSLLFSYIFADGDQGVPGFQGDGTDGLADIRTVIITLQAESPDTDPITRKKKTRTQIIRVNVRNI